MDYRITILTDGFSKQDIFIAVIFETFIKGTLAYDVLGYKKVSCSKFLIPYFLSVQKVMLLFARLFHICIVDYF